MPASEKIVKKHVDKIIKALKDKNTKNILKELYKFGSFLQLQHPDKDYIAMQEFFIPLTAYQNLSVESVQQLAVLSQIISDYSFDRAETTAENANRGDLSLHMIDNAFKNAIFCFSKLVPHCDPGSDEMVAYVSKVISSQPNRAQQVNNWMDQAVSTARTAKKYDINYLADICKEIEEQLLTVIASEKKDNENVFYAFDQLEDSILTTAEKQYDKIKELHKILDPQDCDLLSIPGPFDEKKIDQLKISSNISYVRVKPDQLFYVNKTEQKCWQLTVNSKALTAFDKEMQPSKQAKTLTQMELGKVASITSHTHGKHPHQKLFIFLMTYNNETTKNLLNKNSLGKKFMERVNRLLDIWWEKGFSVAYGMWSHHKKVTKNINKLEKEFVKLAQFKK